MNKRPLFLFVKFIISAVLIWFIASNFDIGTAIGRYQAFGWWQDTDRITKLNFTHGASGDFASGTKVEVFAQEGNS